MQATDTIAPNRNARTSPSTLAGAGAGDNLAYLIKRVVVSIARHADSKLAVRGLTNAQWVPLTKLRNDGPSAVVELARDCRVDAGAMTRLLDRLEKKNLCKRSRSAADRRVVRIELTPDGAAVAAQVHGLSAEIQNAHLAGFSITETRALRNYLQRMVSAGDAMRALD